MLITHCMAQILEQDTTVTFYSCVLLNNVVPVDMAQVKSCVAHAALGKLQLLCFSAQGRFCSYVA